MLTLNRQSPIDLPIPPLTLAPLPATHTVLPLSRGIDGEFASWREALAPKPPAHPALSSSTTRAPGSSKNFVRGKGSYAPFLPGGLDEGDSLQNGNAVNGEGGEDLQEEEEEEDGWKTRAPGLKRGVQLTGGEPHLGSSSYAITELIVQADEFLAEMLGQQSIAPKARRRRRDGNESPELQISRLGDDDVANDGPDGLTNGLAGPSKKNVDDLLPVGVSSIGSTALCV